MKNLRTIQAESLSAALAEVQRTLGDGAVILHTRTVERRALFGLRRTRFVEVTAACANLDLPSAQQAAMVPRGLNVTAVALDPAEGAAMVMAEPRQDAALPHLRPLRADQPAQMRFPTRALPRPACGGAQLPAQLRQTHLSLLASEVADEIADELCARLHQELSPPELADPVKLHQRLAEFVAALLPTVPDAARASTGSPRVVALVGAAGVGKTSTAVKLAADCTLRRRGRAALITLDAERAGALEQLGAYADILGLPLRSAETPDELRAALAYLLARDLVVIDTAGCNPADTVAMSALADLLRAAGACEIHLVLPACGSPSALRRTIDGFSALGCCQVVFTKLDEAVGCGVMLECLRRAKMRLSYVSAGPNVLDDFAPGDARQLAELVLSPTSPAGDWGAPR